MGCFGHINQSGPTGMYQGRFGAYEVSVRNNPAKMNTEVIMCHQEMCAAQEFDEYELHRMHRGSGDPVRELVFEAVARQLELKIEETRHQSMMRVSHDPAEAMYPPHQTASAVRRQIEEANRFQREYRQECRLRADEMRVSPQVQINIDASHTPKKKKNNLDWMKNLSLREQLQIETDEWLKEVKAA